MFTKGHTKELVWNSYNIITMPKHGTKAMPLASYYNEKSEFHLVLFEDGLCIAVPSNSRDGGYKVTDTLTIDMIRAINENLEHLDNRPDIIP